MLVVVWPVMSPHQRQLSHHALPPRARSRDILTEITCHPPLGAKTCCQINRERRVRVHLLLHPCSEWVGFTEDDPGFSESAIELTGIDAGVYAGDRGVVLPVEGYGVRLCGWYELCLNGEMPSKR